MLDASGASVILYTNNRVKSPGDRARVICGLMIMLVEAEKFGNDKPREGRPARGSRRDYRISNRKLPLLEGMPSY
jgi:hypothetical protein